MRIVKNILVWSNPLTYVFGAPIFVGIVLAAMFDGVARKTAKVIKEVSEDFD